MEYSKILIIRIDFLGDMICTTPFIQAIKNKWPNSQIHVLANKYNSPILENNPNVNYVHTYVYSKECERNIKPGKLNALVSRLALIFKLRKIKFDIGIVPNGGMHKNSINFLRQLNIPDVRWHTHETEFDDRNQKHVLNRAIIHECLSGFKLMPELDFPEEKQLKLQVYPLSDLRNKWLNDIGKHNGYRVGLFVSNKSVARKWDISKWCNLINVIDKDVTFFVFHDPKDNVCSHFWGRDDAVVINTDSIQDMIAATSCMDLVVSADSAPIHLSSALNIPVVALFENRPEKYLRWYPIGVRYKLLKSTKIVNDIAPEKVAEAINYLLVDG